MADSVRIELDTAGLGQVSARTCWQACAAMLYRWKKRDPAAIPGKLSAAGLPADRYTLTGLGDGDLGPVAAALGFMGWNAEAVLGWDLPRIAQQLRRYGPHKVGLKTGQGKHAVVVHGADEGLDQIRVANPWSEIAAGSVESGFLTLKQFRRQFNPVPFSIQSWQ